jgi:uncharacterized protein (TIGR02588 family)
MSRRTPSGRNSAFPVELVLAIVSGCLVIAMAGYLLHAAFFITPSPVSLAVSTAPADDQGQVRYTVRNDGGRTASNVYVSVVLRDGERLVGRRTVMLDYVPPHSEISGGLLLQPGELALEREFVVEGYMDP